MICYIDENLSRQQFRNKDKDKFYSEIKGRYPPFIDRVRPSVQLAVVTLQISYIPETFFTSPHTHYSTQALSFLSFSMYYHCHWTLSCWWTIWCLTTRGWRSHWYQHCWKITLFLNPTGFISRRLSFPVTGEAIQQLWTRIRIGGEYCGCGPFW